MVSQVDLKSELASLGVRAGGVLMVHASLRKLRPEGGAVGLLSVLKGLVGPHGTLLLPLGAEPGAPFDPLVTPAEKELGVLNEVFRQHEGVEVNDHVAARFGAWGPAAAELLEHPPLDDYYGSGSTLERFTQKSGQVLRLGADANTVTLTHWAEYLADVPGKRRVRIRYERAHGGVQLIESLDDSEGIRDWPQGDYFADLFADFLRTNQVCSTRIGDCPVELFEARTYVPFAVEWLEKHLA